MPERVFVIAGGASWSLADVDRGVMAGLRHHDVTVLDYATDARIARAHDYLGWAYQRAVDEAAPGVAVQRPTTPDILLFAYQDALTKALLHQPDWVLIVSGMFMPRPFLELLERASGCAACRNFRIGLLLTESPYDLENERRWAVHADAVWTNERTVVETLRQVNPETHYLPHAWLPGWHDRVIQAEDPVPAHDVVFVGTGFHERIELLEAINWDGIDFGLYGQWQELAEDSPLQAHLRGGVQDNAAAAALYRHAKIGLNLHRQSIGWDKHAPRIMTAESLNPRAYELAATGCFQISDVRKEGTEMFGAAVPTFRTPEECEAMIRGHLADAGRRRQCARAAERAVVNETWHARAEAMLAVMTQVELGPALEGDGSGDPLPAFDPTAERTA